MYVDNSSAYANNHNLYINFLSVATGRAVRFKAFLSDFKDNFDSKWNEETVYGRMDPIVTFQATTRALGFAFDVPSAGYTEAVKNFQKLSLLLAMLYPAYSEGFGANTMTTAPLFKVSFSTWINAGQSGTIRESGLVGAIKGIKFAPDLEAGVYDDPAIITPKTFSISCDMTVLHTTPVGWRGTEWRGVGGFPYGEAFAEQPEGLPLPDLTVTQQNDLGASGTDEMVDGLSEEFLDPSGSPTAGGPEGEYSAEEWSEDWGIPEGGYTAAEIEILDTQEDSWGGDWNPANWSLFGGNSDIRLKTDIRRVGVSSMGIPLYTFRYRSDKARVLYHGAMAQDLLANWPEAVSVSLDGFYNVNYGVLDVDFYPVKLGKNK